MCRVCGARALGAQPRALLDAEAMLLVDDRQAQAGRNPRLRSAARASRPRASASPLAKPARRARVARALALAAEDGFDARRRTASSSGASFARVLRREDFGRRHQRATARRCATRARSRRRRRASFRCRRRPAAGGSSARRAPCRPKSRNRSALRARERERQRRLELLEQARRHAQRARVAVALALGAPQLRRRRERQELAEDEALARALALLPASDGACTARYASRSDG